MPLIGPVLEPTPPYGQVWAVLGVPGPVGLDEPEAALREEAECLGVVIHATRLGAGERPRGRSTVGVV
jgi:hypothetical protein